eukprot:6418370-Prymnesium_polylepis.1
MAVAGHSTLSKEEETLMTLVEASASAGANSEEIQSPAVMPELCLPLLWHTNTCACGRGRERTGA